MIEKPKRSSPAAGDRAPAVPDEAAIQCHAERADRVEPTGGSRSSTSVWWGRADVGADWSRAAVAEVRGRLGFSSERDDARRSRISAMGRRLTSRKIGLSRAADAYDGDPLGGRPTHQAFLSTSAARFFRCERRHAALPLVIRVKQGERACNTRCSSTNPEGSRAEKSARTSLFGLRAIQGARQRSTRRDPLQHRNGTTFR